MQTINLGELMDGAAVNDLIEKVGSWRDTERRPTIHNCIMKWLDCNELIMRKVADAGMIKPYFAYLLEYQLKLK